jgi:hypothetical protein
MKQILRSGAAVAILVLAVASCKKDDDNNTPPVVNPKDSTLALRPYTVPTTYSFSNANYATATQRAKIAIELDNYLKTANVGAAKVALDAVKVTNLFENTNAPYTDASLNTSGQNLRATSDMASTIKAYADSVVIFNNEVTASKGTGGYVARGANKIIVGPTGLEYGQAYTKGIMATLFFKEPVRLLSAVKAMKAIDTAAAQALWDEAFGLLAIPADYDSSKTYASTDANRPLLWGGYLAERGKPIQAGGTIFQAFLKGRAAIGGFDSTVRNQQIDIILNKWEQLSAAAALNYVTAPTASSAVGNYGTQLHALSEGFGFILTLKYRPSTSKLTEADFRTLSAIINTDFYTLVNQPGFTDLVKAQTILKNTYGL